MILLHVLLTWGEPAFAARRAGPMAIEDVAAACAGLVRGRVLSATTREDDREVVTRYVVRVDRVLLGVGPSTLGFDLPGGWYRGARVAATGFPVWKPGDEVLLFVDGGGSILADGAFSLRDETVMDPLERPISEVPTTVSELARRAAPALRSPAR